MRIFVLLAAIQLALGQSFQDDNILDGQLSIVVEDNLGSGAEEWSERSVISVRSIKLNQAQITHTRPWDRQMAARLKDLAEGNAFYKLRLYEKNGKEPNYVYTFTDACLVYEGGLSEILSVVVDTSPQQQLVVVSSSTGGSSSAVIGASVSSPAASHCSDLTLEEEQQAEELVLRGFNSTVLLRTSAIPVQPDTATFIQKMESLNKEKLENKDNRSFFAKYWMYIIPFVLLLAISNGGQETGGR